MATALLPFECKDIDPRLERSVWYHGALMTVHADAAATKGTFALIEVAGKPGMEPPLHVHRNEDELFYVLEGRLRVTRGNEELILEAGDSGYLPRTVPHTFKICSGCARFLNYVTPAGFEEFFRTLGRPAERLALEENPPSPDYARIRRIAEQFSVSFVQQP